MITIEFSEQEVKILNRERYYHVHPRVRRKLETLWLKNQQLAHDEICRLADISEPTLCNYLKEYQQGGIKQLEQLNFYRPESELIAYTESLQAHFQEHPPATVKAAMAEIVKCPQLSRHKISKS